MKSRIPLQLLLPLTLPIALGLAPPSVSLEDAVQQALERNPNLTRAHAASEAASWKPLEAISVNLPRLGLSATHYFDIKYQLIDIDLGAGPVTFPTIYPKTFASLDALWTVFDGLQGWNSFQAARDTRDAAQLEESRARLQVESNTKLAFYKALSAQQLADVAAQNVKTLQDHAERVEQIHKQGKATRYDSLRVEVQLSEAIPEEAAARDNVVLTRQALDLEMGLDEKERDGRPLKGVLPEPVESRLPSDLKAEPQSRADVQALVSRAQAATHLRASSYGAFLPKVTFIGQKLYYNNVGYEVVDTSRYRDAYSLGVTLTWSFFDGGATIARNRQAVHEHDAAEAAAAAALQKIPNDIELWKRRYRYNAKLYQARKQAIAAAEESVRLARLGNQAGTRTSTDVLDSELDLFRARAGAVRAQLDAAESWINLELSLGRKL